MYCNADRIVSIEIIWNFGQKEAKCQILKKFEQFLDSCLRICVSLVTGKTLKGNKMEPTAPQTNNKTWDSMPELPSWNIPSWGATATGGKNVQSDTNLSMNNLPILSRNGSLTSQSMNQLPDTKDVYSGGASRSSNDQIQHSIAQNSNISPTNNANSDASAAATIQEQLTTLVMLQNQQLQQQQEQLKNQRLKIEELREELHLEKESRRRQSLLLQSMAQGGQGSKQGVGVGGEQLGQAGQPGNLRQPYQAYGATPQQQWIAAQQQQAQVQQQAQYQNQNPYGAMNGVGMRGTQQAINPYANLSGVVDPYKQSMNGVGSVGGVHPGQTPGFIGMGGGGAPNIMSSDPSARVTSPYGHEQLPHRLEFNRATGEWVEIGHVHGQGGVQNVVQNGMQNGMQGLGVQGLGVQGLGVQGLGVQGLGVQDQIGGVGGGMDPRATGFVPSSPDGRTNGKGVVRKVISSNGTVVQSSGTSQSRRSNGRANQASVIDSEKIIGGEEERTTL